MIGPLNRYFIFRTRIIIISGIEKSYTYYMLPHILTGQHDLYLRKVMADSEEIRKCIKKHIEKRIDVFFVSLCGYVCGV